MLLCVAYAVYGVPSGLRKSHLPLRRRTLVDERCAPCRWTLACEHGVLIASADKPSKKKYTQNSIIKIGARLNDITVNGASAHTCQLLIMPVGGALVCAGKKYHGTMLASVRDGRASLVAYDPPRSGKHNTSWLGTSASSMRADADKKIRPTGGAKHLGQLDDLAHQPHFSSKKLSKKNYSVRVLLDEQKLTHHTPWAIASDQGFVLVDPDNGHQKVYCSAPTMTVGFKRGIMYLNGKRYSRERVKIVPVRGMLTFNGNTYQGAFVLSKYEGNALLVNSLDIEQYVYSVLRSESWPGWPLEVNKAFAIMCRTYVIAMVLRSASNTKPYHIQNTNIHQVYNGFHKSTILQQAIEQTRGVFLSYDKKPIVAMFDSCCGGIIPARMKDVDFKKAPYLARKKVCTYCKNCSLYSWRAEYPVSTVLKALNTVKHPHIKQIKDMKISNKDAAGAVHEVSVKDKKRTVHVAGKKVYSLFKKVKSFCFTIKKKANSVVFTGRGYGHHLGVCQWGAREMVRRGYSYKKILQFYYPNTTFMRLS